MKHHRTLRGKVMTMERYGITRPIEVHANGIMKDGNHRLIMAEYLGLPRIIGRVVD